jgi:hypothetical protein
MLRSPFRQDDKENLSLYDLFQRITKGQLDPDQRFDISHVC